MAGRFQPLRAFIFDRLYHPAQGYFCRPDFQVGELGRPLDFRSFIGYDDYQRALAANYPPNAWLTPSEIFKPYYGMTIARYLQAAHARRKAVIGPHKLKIVEAGAGTGSAAESILYYFASHHRQLLPELEYTVVEISGALSARVQGRLKKAHPRLFSRGQVSVVNDDISNYKQHQPCFLLFFEVLDNLPHDKLLWNQQAQTYDRFLTVDPATLQESSQPVEEDQLVRDCLRLHQATGPVPAEGRGSLLTRTAEWVVARMAGRASASSRDLFLPTYLLRLLRRLRKNVPEAHLVVSDFDQLVGGVPGLNAPIVSRKGLRSQDKKDYPTYLVGRGEADIFFPVDFQLLARMHEEVLGRGAAVAKSHEFMGEFSEEAWAQTRSRFNPIREDFGNTSFLVSEVSRPQGGDE